MEKEECFTPKHDRVLEIYSRLIAGEIIRKQELAKEYGVTPRSIQRDIDSIRDFCSNRAANRGESIEVCYDRIARGFRMVSSKTVTLTNAELFSVAKILLESRSLNRREMGNIIENLINACLPIDEKKKMSDLIRNELFHYVEPRHGRDLVNDIWKLGAAVYAHKKVDLEYQKVSGEITTAIIKPVGIMESEYYFYLIAYIGNRDKEQEECPTIYRIDRIKQFRILDEKFHVPYKKRFEEGEFRKRIPFMYGGKLQRKTFVYTGTDINAILDRLPTAKAVQQEDGSYLVTADIFGDIGLNLWMNGQKDIHLVEKGGEEK